MNRRLLALLPGLDGTGECFRPFCRILPPRFESIVVGYPCETALTYEEATDYAADRLPHGERVVLLGESYSGPVALRIAARHPDRVSALVLCSTFVTPPHAFVLRMLSAILPVSFLFRHPPRLLIRYFMAGRDASKEYLDWVVRNIRTVRGDVLAARVRNITGVDVRRELAECSIPTLYIRATGDTLIGNSTVEEIAALRSDIEIARLPGPHQILQRQPECAIEAIRTFLEAHGL